MPSNPSRPRVAVIVPFHGTPEAALALLDAVGAIRLRDGDVIVVADNTGARAVPERDGVTVVRADGERSSYHARNVGAEATDAPWLAFVDADTTPAPDLLEAFFATPVPEGVGAVLGEVHGRTDQPSLVARYSRARGHISQRAHWEHPRPFGVTANLLVRREAWADVGGFLEGVRSSGDVDFSWRLQEAGWRLDYRPDAFVEHRHRETLRQILRVGARYGAGRAWLHRRYPDDGMGPAPLVRPLTRAVVGTAVWTVCGRFERAAFKALDGAYVTSQATAGLLANTPPGPRPHRRPAAVLVAGDRFPALDAPPDDGERARRAAGAPGGALVEARSRPLRPDRVLARELGVRYAEDAALLGRLGAAARLLLARPRAVLDAARRFGVRPVVAIAPSAHRAHVAGVRDVVAVGGEPAAHRADLLAAVLRARRTP